VDKKRSCRVREKWFLILKMDFPASGSTVPALRVVTLNFEGIEPVSVNLDELSQHAAAISLAMLDVKAGISRRLERESVVWAHLRENWKRYRLPGLSGLHHDPARYRLQRIEADSPKGVPDLLVLDRYWGECAWIEFKAPIMSPNWPSTPLTIDVRPEQALWTWQWYRDGGRAGIFVKLHTRQAQYQDGWVWIPARHDENWPVLVRAPNGWMLVPHVMGTGPVPDPATLWSLDADSRPVLRFDEPDYEALTTWPRDPLSRIKDVILPSSNTLSSESSETSDP
jgi:hypothetical protein